jgi:hypothetical protein
MPILTHLSFRWEIPLTLLSLASCEDMFRLGEAVILALFGITMDFFQLILI